MPDRQDGNFPVFNFGVKNNKGYQYQVNSIKANVISHCLVEAGFTLPLTSFSFSIYTGLHRPLGLGCPNVAPSIPCSLPGMNVVSYCGSPMFVTSVHRGMCHQSYAQQHKVIFQPYLCFSDRSCQANKSRFYFYSWPKAVCGQYNNYSMSEAVASDTCCSERSVSLFTSGPPHTGHTTRWPELRTRRTHTHTTHNSLYWRFPRVSYILCPLADLPRL